MSVYPKASPESGIVAFDPVANRRTAIGDITNTPDVAEAVFQAATDPAFPMILPGGADAIA